MKMKKKNIKHSDVVNNIKYKVTVKKQTSFLNVKENKLPYNFSTFGIVHSALPVYSLLVYEAPPLLNRPSAPLKDLFYIMH